MRNIRNVTDFEIEMLKLVIGLYIETGKPISSGMLKSFYRLHASTANIRKVLHQLEEKGYLRKPHVSAGRIPTDLGYRFYVDGIKHYGPLAHKIVDKIRRKIRQDWSDIRDVMWRTSQLLNELTNYMGIIMGVFQGRGIVERMHIVQLEGNGGLVVLALLPDMERRVYIEFTKRYHSFVIDRAAQIINERIAGYPLDEAHERIKNFLREGVGTEREIAAAVSSEAEYLFNWEYDLKYYFKGTGNIVVMPELSNPKILQSFVRIMGERDLMLRILRQRMDDELMVTIGSENEEEELEHLSVVTRRFSTCECEGVMGILGPTRMTYGMVLSLLNRMAKELHSIEIRNQ